MEQIYATQEEAKARVEALCAEGWEAVPCDNPEAGRKGWFAFRHISETTGQVIKASEAPVEGLLEETIFVQWEMFGKPLTPDIADDITVEALVRAIRAETVEPALCDDPKRLQLGFVWYHPDKGTAVTRRMRLTQFKRSFKRSTDACCVVKNLRDRLLAARTS